MTQAQWLQLAKKVTSVYEKNEKQVADKGRLVQVLEAFEATFKARTSNRPESDYLGNLISTGKWEGTIEEVMGTVEGQIQKTINFINRQNKDVYCSQAKLYSENLVKCLEKETFDISLDSKLLPFQQALTVIGNGNY